MTSQSTESAAEAVDVIDIALSYAEAGRRAGRSRQYITKIVKAGKLATLPYDARRIWQSVVDAYFEGPRDKGGRPKKGNG